MARILLAEDDDSLREFLTRALVAAGHTVSGFGRGDEALACLRLEPGRHDIIVTDIMMPELDGITLAKEAARIDAAVKVVFITGFAAVALNPASGLAQNQTVLSKPFHLRDLVQAIESVLAPARSA